MPNRTIYVSDDDQEVFKRAQELAGDNLSAAITNAVKRYVAAEMGRLAGFDEITVKVGTGAGRKVRFSGVLLGDWINTEGERFEHYRVYRGPTGKFAIHVERAGHWEMRDAEGNQLTGWRAWTGIGMAAGGGKPAHATLEVVDTLEELRKRIPTALYDMVAASVDQPFVEDLDI
ncbi:MAG TPA: EXLDI protein [Actinomycetota bacterium]|nr:EXLDI protein [Actinomycetota bacterium]